MLIIHTNINYTIKHISNLCFKIDEFLDKMKTSLFLPIFKIGNINCTSNYRPISLLPQISKLLKIYFTSGLIVFLTNYIVISNFKYGFNAKISISHALADVTHFIT